MLRAAGSGKIHLTHEAIQWPPAYQSNSIEWDPLREYTVLECGEGKGVIKLDFGPQAAPKLITVLLDGETLILNGDRYWLLR